MDVFDFKCDETLVKKAKNACNKMNECKSFVGRIVTGDQFVADPEKIRWLSEEFSALACEMEGGSIAQVCHLNSIPFVVIRSASDNANNGAHIEYEKFKPIAVKNSVNILKNMVETM
jgi:adenosylhomocysteine nucleosidase